MNRKEISCIILTSMALILSFPPFPTGFFATIALIPFLYYLKSKRWGKAFRGGYIVGFIWAGGTIYWIGWATIPGLFGVLLILPLYFAVFAVFQTWLWKQWGEVSLVATPFLWTGIEILSSFGSLGFPWNSLAYTQTYYPVLIQYASITGMYGVTFWVVLINVLFYFFLTSGVRWKRALTLLTVIAVMFIVPLVYGKWICSKKIKHGEKIRLTLIQGNIDPYKKWTPSFIDSNFTTYRRLTNKAKYDKSDLIVWPETATPCYLRHRLGFLKRVKSQVDSMGVHLLTGSPDYEWINESDVCTYNAALLIHPDSWKIDWYYKMNLVPFSERVPLVDKLSFLYYLSSKLDMDIGDYCRGDSVVVFEFTPRSIERKVYFAVVICYESVFPYLVRKFVKRGAQFLVVITNDGWFGKTSGPYQHAQIAVFRAIENRMWVARCANTGVSGFIDPFGKVMARTDIYKEAVLGYFISLGHEKTFFLKYGYLFLIFIFVINGVIFIMTFVRSVCK